MIMQVELDDLHVQDTPRTTSVPNSGASSSSAPFTVSGEGLKEPFSGDTATRYLHNGTGTHNHGNTEKLGYTNPSIDVTIRWNMVFTWQAPTMMLGYSVVAFYIGLAIYVCAPLYDGHEGEYLNAPAKVRA